MRRFKNLLNYGGGKLLINQLEIKLLAIQTLIIRN